MKTLLTVGAVVIAMVIVVLAQGIVIAQVWNWFLMPQFHTAPMTIPAALGIAILIQYILKDRAKSKNEMDDLSPWMKLLGVLFVEVGTAVFTLGLAYIVHLFI